MSRRKEPDDIFCVCVNIMNPDGSACKYCTETYVELIVNGRAISSVNIVKPRGRLHTSDVKMIIRHFEKSLAPDVIFSEPASTL